MTAHYLKIALRNMHRFKLQTIVCLTGLAVGMTCFALGTLWLRFIESYENFVPDGENVCFVSGGLSEFRSGYQYGNYVDVGHLLKDSLPEVVDYGIYDQDSFDEGCNLVVSDGTEDEGRTIRFDFAFADDGFFRILGIKPLSGSVKNLVQGDVILTESVARQVFGTEKVLGKELLIGRHFEHPDEDDLEFAEKKPYTVRAIIPDCPENTQFKYKVLAALPPEGDDDRADFAYIFVRMSPRSDFSALLGQTIKLHNTVQVTIEEGFQRTASYDYTCMLLPLRSLRTEYTSETIMISATYVRWFMLLGVLVILCSLANYIITMVSHLRRRAWEFSLRRVLGSSRAHILFMVGLETLLLFLLATALAMLLTWLVLPFFREYSGIEIPFSSMTLSLVGYLALVIAAGCALSAVVAWIVMKTKQANILGARQLKHSSTLLDRVGVILQLALSMGIIFSTTIMLRQVNYLIYSEDIGFARADMGLASYMREAVNNKIRQSPLVEEILENSYQIFPKNSLTEGHYSVDSLGNASGKEREVIKTEDVAIDSALIAFYHARLVAGRLPVAGTFKALAETQKERYAYNEGIGEWMYREVVVCPKEGCINEQMCKALGWTLESAVGKKLYSSRRNEFILVTGVLKDWYVLGPTIQPAPMVFIHSDDDPKINYRNIVFRSKPGRVGELCDSIEAWKKADADCNPYSFVENIEKRYGEYVASEQMLIKILLAVGLASLFVCVIGTFSLVSLSLQQRRKEIAIRKVHGARLPDILRLFLRGQLLSLFLAALVAYPIAYLLMRHWLEGYQKQVAISWWLIPGTFLGIAAVVLFTITLKIWRAAKESTVEALNS